MGIYIYFEVPTLLSNKASCKQKLARVISNFNIFFIYSIDKIYNVNTPISSNLPTPDLKHVS